MHNKLGRRGLHLTLATGIRHYQEQGHASHAMLAPIGLQSRNKGLR
jgi:hypothetical protein